MSLPPQGPPPWSPQQGPPPQWQPGPWSPPGAPGQWPPQGGPPGPWPPQQNQPWQWPPPPPPRSRSNTGVVIGILATVVVVVLIAAAFGVRAIVKSENAGGDAAGAVSQDERAANAVSARSLTDFDVVCGKGSVSNAADYRKPYSIAAFRQGDRDDSWSDMTLDSTARYRADPEDLTSINVVACLSRKAGTEVKSGTCEFDSSGDQVSVDHYAVQYDVQLYEAKTGKGIENLGTISGPATDCPFLVFFDRRNPKIYGSPDTGALEDKLAQFAG